MSNIALALFAFAFGVIMLAIGGVIGYLVADALGKTEPQDIAAARTLKPYDRYRADADNQLAAAVPAGVAREVQKEIVPSGKVFGKMEYEDVQQKFLDNFLLKYFHAIIILPHPNAPGSPWKSFCVLNDWAKGMPEVFWLMTGYRPDEYQLNCAISEYARRVNLSKAVNK